MAIPIPTVDSFSDTTVMRVIRKVVNYIIQTIVPGINTVETTANEAESTANTANTNANTAISNNVTAVTIAQGTSSDSVKITLTKASGDVVSNEYEIATGEVSIVQNNSGITINGTSLQNADSEKPGLMTPSYVFTLNTANSNASTALTNANNITAYVGTDDELIPSS